MEQVGSVFYPASMPSARALRARATGSGVPRLQAAAPRGRLRLAALSRWPGPVPSIAGFATVSRGVVDS